MRYLFHCALAAGLMVGGCESPPERAGNTIDLHNDLATTYPDGATITVSYRFAFLKESKPSSGTDGSAHSFFFTEAGPSRPQQYLQVRVAQPQAQTPPAPQNAARVWLGKRRYHARAECLSADAAAMPPALARFFAEMGDKAPPPGSELLVRAFYPDKPEPDGREIHVVFVQNLAPLGLTCAVIGDPVQPSRETVAVVRGIEAEARRSFEIKG